MTSNTGRLAQVAKSSGISVVGILFSAFLIAMAGIVLYVSRGPTPAFVFEGKKFYMSAVVKNDLDGREIYMPIYEELKR